MRNIGQSLDSTHDVSNVVRPDKIYAITVVAKGRRVLFHIKVSSRKKTSVN